MRLVLAVTGATGAHAARLLVERSPWPVSLVASRQGKDVYRRESGDFDSLASQAASIFEDDDLAAPISSGSVATVGMVVLPCTTNTLGKIAGGIADSLITRAAHCHLKERRPLVLCVRETPWSLINIENARTVAAAGGIIMPVSPPYYMMKDASPDAVTLTDVLTAYVDRVLAVLGHRPEQDWGTLA